MKKLLVCLCLLIFAAGSPFSAAQESAGTEARSKAPEVTTPVKIQIVFAEFDGEKKIKSLPYTLYHNTSHGSLLQADFTKLRLSTPLKVPAGGGAFRLVDLATNLDCRAVRFDDGHFLLQLGAERFWAEDEMVVAGRAHSDAGSNPDDQPKQPVMRNVRLDLYLSLRDGQTVEAVAATDPVSGKVLRILVTLNVLK